MEYAKISLGHTEFEVSIWHLGGDVSSKESWLGEHQWKGDSGNQCLHTIFHSCGSFLINLPYINSDEQDMVPLMELIGIENWKIFTKWPGSILNCHLGQLDCCSRANSCNWIINSWEKSFVLHLKWVTTYADIDEKKHFGGDFLAQKIKSWRKISKVFFIYILLFSPFLSFPFIS